MFQHELPTELTLLILSDLPLASIAYLRRLNHEWSYFITQNATTVYRNAAIHHGYAIETQALLSDLDASKAGSNPTQEGSSSSGVRGGSKSGVYEYSAKMLRGVDSWEALCKRQKLIQHSWSGHAPSRILSSPRVLPSPLLRNDPTLRLTQPGHHGHVHRLKVDEQLGLTLATTGGGGLIVRDIETDEVLWELPIWYVHRHAHLEYEKGYFIVDRTDGSKEVWRRTQDVEADEARRAALRSTTPSSSSADSNPNKADDVLPLSNPDERQRQVADWVQRNGTSSNPRAQFSPHCVLYLPPLESSRAFRFVYPNLLVAARDRAYVFDVRSGHVVQVVQGVQRVRRVRVEEEEEDLSSDQGEQEGSSKGATRAPGDENEVDNDHSDSDSSPDSDAGSTSSMPSLNTVSDSSDSEGDDDDYFDDAQFIGQIRYVEISARHIFIAGLHVLRVFSRKTGLCVLNLVSTKKRYGAWGWRVSAGGEGGGEGEELKDGASAKGKAKAKEVETEMGTESVVADSYETARGEGREAIRMPLKFDFQSDVRERDDDFMLVDQFVAVHASRDGKHFAALLSGARLIVVHHFEEILARHRVPAQPHDAHAHAHPQHARKSTKESKSSSARAKSRRQDRVIQREARRRRDRDLFMHTMDIRLGSPRCTESVYLAYEHGRIGVVTSNAVYVVHPTIPPPPAPRSSLDISPAPASPTSTSSSSLPDVTYTYPPPPPIRISRLPYFVNPSWLIAVSCLMMSDTGLYLNWNPTSPVVPPYRDHPTLGMPALEDEDEDMDMDADLYADFHEDDDEHEDVAMDAEASVGSDEAHEADEPENVEGDENTIATIILNDTPHYFDGAEPAQSSQSLESGSLGVDSGEVDRDPTLEPSGLTDQDHVGHDEKDRRIWEANYQDDLRELDDYSEDTWYRLLPGGDVVVHASSRALEESEFSTIFAVEFLPEL